MSIDPTLFKHVMAQWSSGITVITSIADDSWQGITANSFASVSVSPPLVSVNIDRKLYIHSIIAQSGVFAANILSADQIEWGKLFAGFYPEIENRFEGISCQIAATGSPILPDVVGWVDCQVRYAFDVGDHTIFVGEAVAGGTPASAPALAYHNRAWGEFVKQPPDRVQLVEVGPSEGIALPAEAKVEIIESLLDAGITRIQVGVFADPMPAVQLADPANVYRDLPQREGVDYSAVALNTIGLENARKAGVTHIDLLVPAHDEYSREMIKLPLSAAMEQFGIMVSQAHEAGMTANGRILCAFGYRESTDAEVQTVVDLARRVLDIGVQEIVLDDSTGVANPLQIRKTLTAILAVAGITPVGVRLNDRQGFGLVNMMAALEAGVTQFETAFGGLRGTLFPSSGGSNIATEDTANLLHSMGIETGISVDKITGVSRRAASILRKSLPGTLYRRANSTEKVVE